MWQREGQEVPTAALQPLLPQRSPPSRCSLPRGTTVHGAAPALLTGTDSPEPRWMLFREEERKRKLGGFCVKPGSREEGQAAMEEFCGGARSAEAGGGEGAEPSTEGPPGEGQPLGSPALRLLSTLPAPLSPHSWTQPLLARPGHSPQNGPWAHPSSQFASPPPGSPLVGLLLGPARDSPP